MRLRSPKVAQALGIREPTLTHHLDNLESSGLVKRVRESGDRRAIRVELTEAGVEAFNSQLASGITRAEERQLRRILDLPASNAGTELD